ncbi:MAG: SufD family Fe-S cluster assembly protein [Actinomycetota bacterium]|nr:SufD family Fe-S cluster assembly protein [Actinomycetota bacterium]
MSANARTHRFEAAALSALGGPSWLADRRRLAVEAFARAPLPTSAQEDWRYGRIDEVDLAEYAPLDAAPRGARRVDLDEARDLSRQLGDRAPRARAAAGQLLERLGDLSGLLVALDGEVVVFALSEKAEAAGVRLSPLAGEATPPPSLGARLAEQQEAFGLLAEAFLSDGAFVDIPPAAVLGEPIALVHLLSDASGGRAVFPRSVVQIGESAAACVIELLAGGDEPQLVVPVSEITLGDNAQMDHLSAQQLGARAVHLGYQASEVARSARLRTFTAAFGGGYARQFSRTSLSGEGADSSLFSVYLGAHNQLEEFRTFQEHVAARTRSELVFKGAVTDAARSVYTGLIRMHKGAKRADASQTNRNLVLSDDAHAYSVPNLDIQENDVRCSHASAVGPVDPEQRFYLESRGVPAEVAERLILLGFFEDLIVRSPHPGFADHLRALVTERLIPPGARDE